MTVSSTTRKAGPFLGNGVTTSFPFSFKVFSRSDIALTLVDENGSETTLGLDSDYSISLNADQDSSPGGTITYPLSGDPLPDGWSLVGLGALTVRQGTDITNLGRFLPQVHENVFDYLTILAQQLDERLTRALLVPASDDAAPSALPTVASRLNKFLGFDAAGHPVVLSGTGADEGLRDDLAANTGSTLIRFLQGGAGSQARTVREKLREQVSVFDYLTSAQKTDVQARAGAVDVAAAIQAANDYAESIGSTLYFPPGKYTAKAKLSMSCPWFGVPGQTTISIPDDFVPSGGTSTELNIAIKNKNFAATYSAATADFVVAIGIDFVIASSLTNLRLGNVRGGLIEHCNFSTDTTDLVSACLDLHSCVKNLAVRSCTFANDTEDAAGGGAVWVRNITTAGNIAANNTENILFDHCRFSTTALDEAIAVYGVRGKTRNVTIRSCTIEGATSAVAHGTLASTFPLNDGYLIGGVSYAAVEGVLWDDCSFIDGNFTNHVLRFGNSADPSQVCRDIKARNCRFYISKASAGTNYALRAIRGVGYGLSAQDCHVYADGSAAAITYAFSGFDLVSGCTTSGNITNAADACEVVADNPRLVGATGANSCKKVHGNRIYSSSTAVVCATTNEFAIEDNYIETGAGGVIFNTLGGSVTPSGEATNNRIVMSNAASFALQASGTTGRLRARGNRVSGTGKTISGTTWAEIAGNDWYGTLDSARAAGYLDFDHNSATPIGTFAASTSPTAGTSRIHLGWIKKANAGVGADWQAVYPETANN